MTVSSRHFDAVHWRELLELFGRDGMHELIAVARADLPTQQARFAQARRERDVAALQRLAHTLRGACQQLGAEGLAAATCAVEAESDPEAAFAAGWTLIEGYADLVNGLEDEIARVCDRR